MLHYCYLPEEYILGDYDVFCGRGTKCHTHIGNRFFRSLIESMLDHYIGSSRRDKIDIITEVIQHVRNLCTSHRGGFIKQNLENWRYYEIGDFLAREKVSQAFRDAARGKNSKGNKISKTEKDEVTSNCHRSLLHRNLQSVMKQHSNMTPLLRDNGNQFGYKTLRNESRCDEIGNRSDSVIETLPLLTFSVEESTAKPISVAMEHHPISYSLGDDQTALTQTNTPLAAPST